MAAEIRQQTLVARPKGQKDHAALLIGDPAQLDR